MVSQAPWSPARQPFTNSASVIRNLFRLRPLWIARRENTSLTASVATIIVERFFDSVMLILLFGWSLLFVHLPAAADATLRLMKDAAWVMLIGSVAAIVFMFFFRSNIDRIVGFIR